MCGQSTSIRCNHLLFSILILLLSISSSFINSVSAIQNPSSSALTTLSFVDTTKIMALKKKNYIDEKDSSSSSVLRELKGTISSQAAEIDRLKKALSSATKASSTTTATKKPAAASAHGHHGSSSTDNEDIFDYKHKSFYTVAFERVGWLAVFLFSLSFTALIMNGFEHTLSKQIELAYFVPLMAGHGGNTGGQAVGTVLSALSAGVITRKDAFHVVIKEAMSGFLMGIILGSLIGPISHYVMGISVHVSTVVSVTFPILSTIAAFLGSILPFVCVILGLDPAVIAAPAMTSFVDVTGLLCYFLLANKIFKLFGMEL